MRKGLILGVVVVAAAAAVVFWLWSAKPQLSDEQQIANTLIEIAEAVETKDSSGVLKHVSRDYADGSYTRRDIARMVIQAMRQPDPYHVHLEVPSIQVSGDQATVRVGAAFSMGAGMSPNDRIQLDIQVQLIKDRGEWEITSAKGWEPAAEQAY